MLNLAGQPNCGIELVDSPKRKIKWRRSKGKFTVLDSIDALNPEFEILFEGSRGRPLTRRQKQVLEWISEAEPGKRSKALNYLLDNEDER